jgi:hypothetical protein
MKYRAIFHLLSSILVFIPAGCSALGVAAYKLAGPPDNPALYTPNKTRPMLVLVENYRHQSSVAAHADTLARQLAAALEAHKVAPVIDLDKLQSLRDSRPAEYPTMSVTRIAQAVGASQVLYVQLHSSDVAPLLGGEGYTGQATASVKIIDADTGATLWPADMSDGYGVSASTQLGTASGAGSPMDVRQRLYVKLTDQIARLFYKWKPEDMRPEGFTE